MSRKDCVCVEAPLAFGQRSGAGVIFELPAESVYVTKR